MTEALPRDFDGYHLKKLLGKGGMGEVHLAIDNLLDRYVAIKFITSGRNDDVARERFTLEARAFARLQHPNVVSIYRVGEVSGYPYLVSEYVNGKPMDALNCGNLDTDEIIQIASGIARGLAAAHNSGVIHRDIKPANVMITEEGESKILDFGIAKVLESITNYSENTLELDHEHLAVDNEKYLEEQDRIFDLLHREQLTDEDSSHVDELFEKTPHFELTRPGMAMGTPRYMAPEIWVGKEATFRSDVYSFGALLFYLCTGTPPHTGYSPREVGKKAISTDAPHLLDVKRDVDDSIAQIVDKCLSRNPDNRYSNGNEIRLAIAQLTPEMRTSKSPEGNPYRGLHPFEVEHRNLFFGRDSEIRLVLNRLRKDPCAVVVGNSGVGKSSLCKAGILPRADSWLQENRTWQTASMVPGTHPIMTLSAVLSPVLKKTEEELENTIINEPANMPRLIRSALGSKRGLVLYIDQLEELVTISHPEETDAMAQLINWLTVPTPGIKLLATIRGDFLSNLAAMPHLSNQLSRHLFFLRPLTAERIRETVEGPAYAKGTIFETKSLIDALVESTSDADGGLPLLQFTLRELWEARDGNQITANSLDSLGGVSGSLARHATNVYEQLPEISRKRARDVLLALVTTEQTRARKTDKQLNPSNDSEVRRVINHMVDGRLLVAGESRNGPSYELAHELLISEWPLLQKWLNENVQFELIRERVSHAAAEWHRLGESTEALWQSHQLEQVSLIDQDNLSELSRAFVRACIKYGRWRKVKILALVLVTPIAFFLVYQSGSENKAPTAAELSPGMSRLDRARQVIVDAESNSTSLDRLRRSTIDAFYSDWNTAELQWSQYLQKRRQLQNKLEHARQLLQWEPRDNRSDVRSLLKRARQVGVELNMMESSIFELRNHISTMVPTPAKEAVVIYIQAIGEAPRCELYETVETNNGDFTLAPLQQTATRKLQFDLPTGSYLLRIAHADHPAISFPFIVVPGGEHTSTVSIPEQWPTYLPMAYIPRGSTLIGSRSTGDHRKKILNAPPVHRRRVKPFFISKNELTVSNWLEFLNELPEDQRMVHIPQARDAQGQWRPQLEQQSKNNADGWQLITPPVNTRLEGKRELVYENRYVNKEQNWLQLPVTGISPRSARAYVAWLNRTNKLPGAAICDEWQWERAARGADGREFPHGNAISALDANHKPTYSGSDDSIGPDEVGMHTLSQSPFGINDMGGNVWEITRSTFSDGYILRGGAYDSRSFMLESAARQPIGAAEMHSNAGLRICVIE